MVDPDVELMPGDKRILIIEPDPAVRDQLAAALQQENLLVLTAGDGRAGLRQLFACRPHLVILALVLPLLDGWAVLDRIRDATDTPVLIVTKQHQPGYRLRAFQMQAQDYLTKPVDAREVVLRVKSILEHRAAMAPISDAPYDDGTLRVDPWNRTVSVRGTAVDMSNREQRILGLLVRRPGRLVRYDEILDAIAAADGDDPDVAVRSLLHRLRRKLEQAAPGTNYIVTQRGQGIRLNIR